LTVKERGRNFNSIQFNFNSIQRALLAWETYIYIAKNYTYKELNIYRSVRKKYIKLLYIIIIIIIIIIMGKKILVQIKIMIIIIKGIDSFDNSSSDPRGRCRRSVAPPPNSRLLLCSRRQRSGGGGAAGRRVASCCCSSSWSRVCVLYVLLVGRRLPRTQRQPCGSFICSAGCRWCSR